MWYLDAKVLREQQQPRRPTKSATTEEYHPSTRTKRDSINPITQEPKYVGDKCYASCEEGGRREEYCGVYHRGPICPSPRGAAERGVITITLPNKTKINVTEIHRTANKELFIRHSIAAETRRPRIAFFLLFWARLYLFSLKIASFFALL